MRLSLEIDCSNPGGGTTPPYLPQTSNPAVRQPALDGLIVLARSKIKGMLVLATDFLSCKQLVGVLYLPGKENDPRPNTQPWLSALLKSLIHAENLKLKKI